MIQFDVAVKQEPQAEPLLTVTPVTVEPLAARLYVCGMALLMFQVEGSSDAVREKNKFVITVTTATRSDQSCRAICDSCHHLLKECSGCRLFQYCGRDCQLEDWNSRDFAPCAW